MPSFLAEPAVLVMLPYKVLARYVPSEWNSKVIGRELVAITERLGLNAHYDPKHGPIHWKRGWYSEKYHAEVRRITLPAPAAGDWHRDGDTTAGANMDCALVVWANKAPTEFQWNGKVFAPKPFELVIARNLGCSHRRPADAPTRRWMFRQRVAVPKHLNLP